MLGGDVMQIELYTNFSDNRYLSKNITLINTVDCAIKDKCPVETPKIVLTNMLGSSINRCNYAYVPQWGRYYYVQNINVDTGGRIELELKVDVLMTYAGQIRTINTVVDRQEFVYNKYISDSNVPVRTNRIVSYKSIGKFPRADHNFVLNVNGGKYV